MAPAPGMFSAFTIWVESFSVKLGLARFVTGGRKPVTVYACVPLVSIVSIVMSHVLRRDNMRTGRGVTHHQHQAAAGRQGPGNWEKVIFRNCNRRLRVPLIFFHLYLQQTNLQLQKVIGVKVCDVEIFLAYSIMTWWRYHLPHPPHVLVSTAVSRDEIMLQFCQYFQYFANTAQTLAVRHTVTQLVRCNADVDPWPGCANWAGLINL